MTIILTQRDLEKIIVGVGLDHLMDEVIAKLEIALRGIEIESRERSGFILPSDRTAILEWMPAMRLGADIVIKVVSYNATNIENRGFPTVIATNSVFDGQTGALIAVLEGTLPTAIRTGAASAIATKYLASPGASVVGIVGCGAQAVTQVHALSRVLPITEVLAFDTNPLALKSFESRLEFLDIPIIVSDLEELEEASEVICTATSVPVNSGPVIAGTRVQANVHINAVGSDLPGKTELPLHLLKESIVVPDYLPQAIREGECQQLIDRNDVGPSLVEVVRGGFETAWQGKRTVFDSTGFALEDQVVTEVIVSLAQRLGFGTILPIFTGRVDPRNPYELSEVPVRPTRQR